MSMGNKGVIQMGIVQLGLKWNSSEVDEDKNEGVTVSATFFLALKGKADSLIWPEFGLGRDFMYVLQV